MNKLPSHRPLLATVALCLLTVVVVALDTDRATSTGQRPPLSVLAGPAASVANLPHVSVFEDVDPATARLAATGTDEQVWVAAGKASYCMYVQVSSTGQGSQACGDLSDAMAGNAAITMAGAGSQPVVRVIGIVPDGVSSVSIASRRGAQASRVSDNIFVAHTDVTASSVLFTKGGRMTTTRLIVEN